MAELNDPGTPTPNAQGDIPMAVDWLNSNDRYKIIFMSEADADKAGLLNQRTDLRNEFKDKFGSTIGKKFLNANGIVDFDNNVSKAWKPTASGTSYDFERDATGDIKDYSAKPVEQTTAPVVKKPDTTYNPQNTSVFTKYGGVANWYNQKPA